MNLETGRSRWLPPDVADVLASARDDDKRQVARTATLFAIERTGLVDPRLEAAQDQLAKEQYGDSPEREAVHALTAELDDIAWDLQEQVDAGQRPYDDYSTAFARARAANAARFALDPDPQSAASEALYEAHHAMDDPAELYAAIRKTLRS